MIAEDPEEPFELKCADGCSPGVDPRPPPAGLVLLDLSLADSLEVETRKVSHIDGGADYIVLTGHADSTVA